MRALGWVVVALLAVVGVISLDPGTLGLSETTPVLQVIARRGLLAVVLFATGVVLLLLALLRRLRDRASPGGSGGRGGQALALGAIALLLAAGHGGVLLERGTGPGEDFGATPDGAIDVLTVNTVGTAGSPEPVVALIDETTPDVVALQGTPVEDAERIAAMVAGSYQLFTSTTGPRPVQASALLVAESLGEYEQATAPATTLGGVWARPVDGTGPELFSVHTLPPVPGQVGTWREELRVLTDLCERVPGAVLAGDLNATIDHASLRDSACIDGSVDTAGAGTWPAGWPALLGAPIDHVLADARAWRAASSEVLADVGGDHRAVLVRLVPAG